MKITIPILVLSLGLTACGSQPGQSTAATKTSASKGEGLIASADCNTCHKPDVKIVGPSYRDIADKYTLADTVKLAGKIINGGSGSWGDVPMTPHPDITEADAKEMVKFILAQK